MKPTLNRLPALPLAIGAVAGIVLWWLGCPWWAAACLILAAVALIYFQQRLPAVVLMATGAWWILAYISTDRSSGRIIRRKSAAVACRAYQHFLNTTLAEYAAAGRLHRR